MFSRTVGQWSCFKILISAIIFFTFPISIVAPGTGGNSPVRRSNSPIRRSNSPSQGGGGSSNTGPQSDHEYPLSIIEGYAQSDYSSRHTAGGRSNSPSHRPQPVSRFSDDSSVAPGSQYGFALGQQQGLNPGSRFSDDSSLAPASQHVPAHLGSRFSADSSLGGAASSHRTSGGAAPHYPSGAPLPWSDRENTLRHRQDAEDTLSRRSLTNVVPNVARSYPRGTEGLQQSANSAHINRGRRGYCSAHQGIHNRAGDCQHFTPAV